MSIPLEFAKLTVGPSEAKVSRLAWLLKPIVAMLLGLDVRQPSSSRLLAHFAP